MTLLSLKAAPQNNPKAKTIDGITIGSLSPVGIPRTELPFPDDDYSFERDRAKTKNTPEGLMPVPHAECKKEHKLSKKLLKKYASNVFQTKALSFPIAYSEPRSYLERAADLFSFLVTKYIDKAISEKSSKSKLAVIATGIIAGFHIDLNPKKVFNPYLGETFVGEWSNGTRIYAEQTSHHPPISDIQIFGPDGKWQCYAHADFEVDSGMNQVEVKQNGKFRLELKDGPIYEWCFPSVFLTGFIKGDKTIKIKSDLEVVDLTNNLICVVEMNPKKNSKYGIEDPIASTILGGVKKNSKKLVIGPTEYKHPITGDYCKEVLYCGKKLWDIDTDISERPLKTVSDDLLLLSDSRFRFDRVLLIQGKLEEADEAKIQLEEIQRKEEKHRTFIKKSPSLSFKPLKI